MNNGSGNGGPGKKELSRDIESRLENALADLGLQPARKKSPQERGGPRKMDDKKSTPLAPSFDLSREDKRETDDKWWKGVWVDEDQENVPSTMAGTDSSPSVGEIESGPGSGPERSMLASAQEEITAVVEDEYQGKVIPEEEMEEETEIASSSQAPIASSNLLFEGYFDKRKSGKLPLVIGLTVILGLAGGGFFIFTSKKEPSLRAKEETASLTLSVPSAPLARAVSVTETEKGTGQAETKGQETPVKEKTSERTLSPPAGRDASSGQEKTSAAVSSLLDAGPVLPPDPPVLELQAQQETAPVIKETGDRETTVSGQETLPEERTIPENQPPSPPVPEKTKPGDLVPLNLVDVPPVPVKTPEPEYPASALRMGIEGRVVINALIDENGKVIQTTVIRGIKGFPALENAAEKAIRTWTFRPAQKDGVNVRVWKPIAIAFKKK